MFKEKIIIEMKEVFKEIPFSIEHTLKVLKNAEDIMKGANMSKIFVIIALLISMTACTNNTSSTPTTSPSASPTTEASNYVPFESDESLFGNIPSALLNEVVTTANTNNVTVKVKDGQITFTSSEGENIDILTNLSNVEGIAWHTDCGGTDYLVALSDGKATTFNLSIEAETNEYLIDYRQDILFDQKIVDIGIYDDTSPFTTCGGATFYYTLEDGSVVNSEGVKRSEAHPYYSFIEVSEDSTVFFFDEDGNYNVYLGNFDLNSGTITYGEPIKYEDEAISLGKGDAYYFDTNLYLIDDASNLYIYNTDSGEVQKYTNASAEEFMVEGENAHYPTKVVISCDGNEFVLEGDIIKAYGPKVSNWIQDNSGYVRVW